MKDVEILLRGLNIGTGERLTNAQLNYLSERLDTLLNSVNLSVYNLQMTKKLREDNRGYDLQIFKGKKLIGSLSVYNGRGIRKVTRIGGSKRIEYDLSLYKTYRELKDKIKADCIKEFLIEK